LRGYPSCPLLNAGTIWYLPKKQTKQMKTSEIINTGVFKYQKYKTKYQTT
jgi:hypothetical protein